MFMKAAGKNVSENAAAPKMKGFLGTIERIGNALPHPFILFLYITGALMILSAVLAGMGVQVTNPMTGKVVAVRSIIASSAGTVWSGCSRIC